MCYFMVLLLNIMYIIYIIDCKILIMIHTIQTKQIPTYIRHIFHLQKKTYIYITYKHTYI